MPSPIVTMKTQTQCPHGAKGTLIPGASKVLVDSGLPLVAGDQGTFTGCAFTVPTGKPQPCVKALLTLTATKVMVENKPVLLLNPADLAQSAEQIPGGPVVWTDIQSKVIAV
jgi:hypothetical protein